MSIPDIHTLTGAYAADALDGVERDEFEAHLRVCRACRDEVAELAATTARLAEAVAQPAPPALRDRVLAETARTRQLSPRVADATEVADLDAARSRRWWRQPATAAAAVLAVVAIGLGAVAVAQGDRADRAEERAARIAAVATDPDRVERTVEADSGGSATVVAADGTALFRTADLRVLPSDRVYQLWLVSGDDVQSAGVLGRGGQLAAIVEDVSATDALAVTVEPSGGSEEPTGEVVLRIETA